MKILKYFFIALAFLAVFYIGTILGRSNLPNLGFLQKGIEGDAELRVTLLMDNNVKNPLPNIEVDLAEKPGSPPKGGVGSTDEEGVASFKVKPGTYFIYFNNTNFPKNLATPKPEQITVVEGKINQKTLLITTQSNN